MRQKLSHELKKKATGEDYGFVHLACISWLTVFFSVSFIPVFLIAGKY